MMAATSPPAPAPLWYAAAFVGGFQPRIALGEVALELELTDSSVHSITRTQAGATAQICQTGRRHQLALTAGWCGTATRRTAQGMGSTRVGTRPCGPPTPRTCIRARKPMRRSTAGCTSFATCSTRGTLSRLMRIDPLTFAASQTLSARTPSLLMGVRLAPCCRAPAARAGGRLADSPDGRQYRRH